MSTTSEQIRIEFAEFIAQFPTLRQHCTPWDAVAFDAWACRLEDGSGQLYAARFALSVWNPSTKWKCGRFDCVDAIAVWDYLHKKAFLRWCAEPFWP